MPCYIERTKCGGQMIICGNLGPHCAAEKCSAGTGYLCDYPVGDNKTCDLPLCGSHAYEVAPNIHYCPGHLVLWKEFRDSGGVCLKALSGYGPAPTETYMSPPTRCGCTKLEVGDAQRRLHLDRAKPLQLRLAARYR